MKTPIRREQQQNDARKQRSSSTPAVPAGAWHALDAVWGSVQRVRLVTGPPSLSGDGSHVRSIHIVGLLPGEDGQAPRLLLVENKDGTFTFAGGRLEPRETLAEALTREVWEEARATIAPDWKPVAATRIEYLNRVPGRIHRFHPSFLLWVVGEIVTLSDEPHHDPADGVVGRHIVTVEEAKTLLGPLETVVLMAALGERG